MIVNIGTYTPPPPKKTPTLLTKFNIKIKFLFCFVLEDDLLETFACPWDCRRFSNNSDCTSGKTSGKIYNKQKTCRSELVSRKLLKQRKKKNTHTPAEIPVVPLFCLFYPKKYYRARLGIL